MKPRLRWKLALLVGGAIAISYFDRQTLPVAIGAIEREIPISNTQFSQLQAAFLGAYVMQVHFEGYGRPLRNPLERMPASRRPVQVRSLEMESAT